MRRLLFEDGVAALEFGWNNMSYGCHVVTTRTARKEHRCYECRGVIRRGESYVIESGIEDGPFAYKMCSDCHPRFEEANRRSWAANHEGIIFGELYDDIFQSRNADEMAAHIRTKLKRSAQVSDWMWKRWREAVVCLEEEK